MPCALRDYLFFLTQEFWRIIWKILTCDKWLILKPGRVPEHLWKDLVYKHINIGSKRGQSWMKLQNYWLWQDFSTENSKVANFEGLYYKIPGFTWADTYCDVKGDIKEYLDKSFMRAWAGLTHSSKSWCILRVKLALKLRWIKISVKLDWLWFWWNLVSG